MSKLVCAIFSSKLCSAQGIRCGAHTVQCMHFPLASISYRGTSPSLKLCCGTKFVESESVSQKEVLSLSIVHPLDRFVCLYVHGCFDGTVPSLYVFCALERMCLVFYKMLAQSAVAHPTRVLCFTFCLHKIMDKFSAMRIWDRVRLCALDDERETK